jgi:hypothetical protein
MISRQITVSRSAAGEVKHDRLSLPFRALEAGRMLVQWYEAPAGARVARTRQPRAVPLLVAAGQALFRSAGTRTINLTLTPAGKRLLKHAKLATLAAKGTFTPNGGTPVTASRIFALWA